VVAVGKAGGRGFVIETRARNRLVLTAAHCLPSMPIAHPWADDDRTWRLLAPLDEKPSIIAECYFVDPVADVAILGPPCDQNLTGAYDTFKRGAVSPDHRAPVTKNVCRIGRLAARTRRRMVSLHSGVP
jgi:hypothetical protein